MTPLQTAGEERHTTRGRLSAEQRNPSANAPAFEVRKAPHAKLGIDLTQIHGLGLI
jgi:hypothetical protein